MKNIISILFLMLTLLSCGDEYRNEPIGDKDNSSAPGPVSNVQVENIPGGAILNYDLPDNVDLQYVKAVYTTSNGAQKDVKASFYEDTLRIEGFGDTKEHLVKLYAVNRMEISSTPVEVLIKPLTPPVVLIRASLLPNVDFGGFVVDFENVAKAEVSIVVMIKDSATSKMVPYETEYTSREKGTFSVRGLPDKENDFAIYVRDRWDNSSDTLKFKMTPMREDYLNKKKFNSKYVAGDASWAAYNGRPEYAYDDVVHNYNCAHTPYPLAFPHLYTLDLGVNVKLSRFKFWQRPGSDVLYQHGAPKHYRIYGRRSDPGTGNANNILEGWMLLMECNSFKPSALPMGQNSSEDIEFAAKGEEFSFPRTIEDVRYLRFEMLESWSGMACSTIGELSFWGGIKE